MKNTIKKTIATILAIASIGCFSSFAQGFTKGADKSVTYSLTANGKDGSSSLSFATKGVDFRILGFYYEDGVVISIENVKDGKRTLAVMDGKFNLKTSTGSDALAVGAADITKNDYEFSIHDFTDDGFPEIIISIRNKTTDEISVHVLEYSGAAGWYSIGEMASRGKKIEETRVFRQALTMKSPAGVLYTWTFHDDHFSFLSSDHNNDPDALL